MRKFFVLILLFTNLAVFAQSDSVTYQAQRRKINSLLDARDEKFGQFDQSLKMHTGIFGFKTKKDKQRSIDILSDIVKTDNNIFHELKALLEYKDFEKTVVQTKVTDVSDRVSGYMQTITKLQAQTDKLNTQLMQGENSIIMYKWISVISVLAALILAVAFFKRN